MRANRRTDTKPELALRHALHRLGYRYRKDYRLDLDSGRRVRPDIVFTARKVAVFVDGCFWHACPEHGSRPRANEWYWSPKLIKNVERDRVNDAALILAGWTVVRLWEHVPLDEAIATVVTTLAASRRPEPTPLPAAGPAFMADSGTPCACSCRRRFRLWPGPCRLARSAQLTKSARRPAQAGQPGRPSRAGIDARLRGHALAARGVLQRR